MAQVLLPGYSFISENVSGQTQTMLPRYGFVSDVATPPVAPTARNRIVILTPPDSTAEGELQT